MRSSAGLIGAAVVGIGFHSVNLETLLQKVILPAIFAPLIAGIVAYVCTRIAYALTSRHDPETGSKLTQKRGGFRTGQIFTSSLVALAHGTNDAQKTMGIITLVLIAAGTQQPGSGPQLWVITACALAIAIGTYAGGWRIIRTMGAGLTEVKPAQGFAAESSTASAILASSHLGFALSTTQVASGSVIGSGHGPQGHDGALGHGGAHRPWLALHAARGGHRRCLDRAAGQDRRRRRGDCGRGRHRQPCCTCSWCPASPRWATTTPSRSKRPGRQSASRRRRPSPGHAPPSAPRTNNPKGPQR